MKSRQRARQARKALVWGLVSFAGVQLAVILVMEYWLPQLRDPNYVFKTARLKQRIREAESRGEGSKPRVVVMVGSSRVTDGLRGSVAEDEVGRQLGQPVILFNLGIRGDGPMNQLLNFERLLADGVRPDLLLVEVMPALLSQQSIAQLNIIPAERMGLRDRALLKSYRLPVNRLTRYTWLCWAAPCYAHRQEILSVLLPTFLPGMLRQDEARGCDRSGWYQAPYPTDPAVRAQARKTALYLYGGVLSQYNLGNDFCPALRHVLDRCRRGHIPAALVLMPEGRSFRQLYSASAWVQLGAFLDDLSATYGAPVINAEDWVPDEDFYDGHHLLPEGASVFTARLAREHLVRLLRDAPDEPVDTPRQPKPPPTPHQHAGL